MLYSWNLIVTSLVVTASMSSIARTQEAVPAFVGSEVCASCHEAVDQAWKTSHHAWAWTLPDETTVLGDFDEQVFMQNDVAFRFMRRDGDFLIETEGPNGALDLFAVEGVAGVAPLQQYLVATEEGRLQALDIAWDVERKRWYHLYPDQDVDVDDGLHWTGPYKSWNARCAECHATGYEKNYDPKARRYDSTQAEIGVGCEACHGPGEVHVAWAKRSKADADRWPGLSEKGFTINFTSRAAETEIQQCAGCHARREPLQDNSPLPGGNFNDSYRLALLRDGLYHADGSIQDEVYVYGSFLQSKMYAQGVRCSDCHDPHGAGLKAEGNALCGQCHSPAGNPRFPSLRQAVYDDPSHHFHENGSEGALCKACHMIERRYMGIDGRRDHSFRVPRPDLTEDTGGPNACTDCHQDRDARWASAEIADRFPESTRRGQHFSQTFGLARKDPTAVSERLLTIAEDSKTPDIVRATALDLLRPIADPTTAKRTEPLLEDADPLVRVAAVSLQRGARESRRVQRLLPMLDDQRKAVRIQAARELLDASLSGLSKATTDVVRKAMGAWQASLLAKADFPETHMAIGGAALVQRNAPAAEQAFREAVRLDPQLVDAWTMIAHILTATGDPEAARDALDDGLAVNPSNDLLLSLLNELDAGGHR